MKSLTLNGLINNIIYNEEKKIIASSLIEYNYVSGMVKVSAYNFTITCTVLKKI